MRVALLSLIERAGDAPDIPLAMLALAGRSLAERQLELALELGCERIVCISSTLGQNLIALQHRAEGAGARFNLIAGPRQLGGMVNAADELVAIAPGLLPAIDEAKAALAGSNGVLVLPVETGIAAGFERIDLNFAWAGVLAMPGALIERLNQLPADCDTISALLRIALQGRVPERSLPDAVLTDRRWALITSQARLAELEPEWLRRHVAPPTAFAPGRAMMRIGIRNFGSKLLAKGWRPAFLAIGGVALAGLALVAAWFEHPAAAIACCALGWLSLEAGKALESLARAGIGDAAGPGRLMPISAILIDIVLIVVLAAALPGIRAERIFAPLVLIGAITLVGRLIAPKWAELAQDRAVLCLLLALASLGGVLLPAIQLLALAAIAAMLGFLRGTAQITQA
ncbi:hypothetical protein SZ64_05090 [Erythrobacter sp. SG61-1L]|uniref:hypothetical protein n=1 Tax=Erythrobacter sp. SG61-1L TaxID=1603897 RepID=UPI0006D6EA57|nr:hypothetical protein [Erythrobacter sp. SG61-1L]KPL67538.1 hypothetical protein SZ64_05090 [Erythrobacter sp. SG61-1L]